MVMENLNVANQSVLESCHSSVIKLDADGNISYISDELCVLAGLDPEQAISLHASAAGPVITDLLQTSGNVEINPGNDARYHFNHTTLQDPNSDGETHIFTNITTMLDLYNENQRLKEEARQLQLIDQDTSLLTKRALLLVLEAQVSRCRRYETPLSVVMMDLDSNCDNAEIKLQLLKLSRLLKDQLRWSDLIARSADTQFTMVLPETEHAAATTLVNKLKDAIKLWGDDYKISFGMGEWKKGINASDLLIRCEDDLRKQVQANNSGQDVA